MVNKRRSGKSFKKITDEAPVKDDVKARAHNENENEKKDSQNPWSKPNNIATNGGFGDQDADDLDRAVSSALKNISASSTLDDKLSGINNLDENKVPDLLPTTSVKGDAPLYKDVYPDHLENVDLSKRTGNYILSVGLPESGKTVLQSFMTFYMDTAGTLTSSLDNGEEDGSINHRAQAIRTDWLESWKLGQFPKATEVGEDKIREIRLNVSNNENKKQKFNLSFLEVSGEDFKNVVPTRDNIPKLFDRLSGYLQNKKIKLNLVFVLTPQNARRPEDPSSDALFINFLDFIRNEIKVNDKDFSLILVLPNTKEIFGASDWEKARKDKRFYERIMKDYIFKNFPATYKTYDRWTKRKRAIMSFYIGDVEVGQLIKPDFSDVKSFIHLNYKMFTGDELRAGGLLRKLLPGS